MAFFVSSFWPFMVMVLAPFASAQNVQSAFIFQGTGLAGSVVDATGCDITYQLECTAGSAVCSDVIKTVTVAGSTSYTMSYYFTSTTGAGSLIETLYDTCRLRSTTVAYCSATAAITVGSVSTSTTDVFVVSDEAGLGYAQVPITAGPAAALRSVSSCSVSGEATSNRISSTSSQHATVANTASSSSSGASTSTVQAGLSTGAKAGIGVGAGVGAVLVLAGIGALLWLRKRKQRKLATSHEPAVIDPHDSIASAPKGDYQHAYEFEQPATKHEMPGTREVQELPEDYYKRYELSTHDR